MRYSILLFFFFSFIIYSASPRENTDKINHKATFETKDDKYREVIKIPLVYISDFEGRFINIDNNDGPDYYDLLKRLKYYKNILPIVKKWESPLTLNNGSSFWPSISVKYILSQPKGINLIYFMLNEAKFDVINIGKKDFYTPYEIMQRLTTDKNILSLPFMSSNSDCKDSQELPICILNGNHKYKIIKIAGIKIAVISVVSQDVLKKAFYKNKKWYIIDAKIISKPKNIDWDKSKLTVTYEKFLYTLEGFEPKIINNVYKTKSYFAIFDAIKAIKLLEEQDFNTNKIKAILYSHLFTPFFIIPLIIVIFVYSGTSSRFFNTARFISISIFITLLLWGILFLLQKLSVGGILLAEIAIIVPFFILLFIAKFLYFQRL